MRTAVMGLEIQTQVQYQRVRKGLASLKVRFHCFNWRRSGLRFNYVLGHYKIRLYNAHDVSVSV